MKFRRSLQLAFARKLLSYTAIGIATAGCAAASVEAQAAPAGSLTFDMTTRFSFQDAPPQTVDAKFYVQGTRVRIETELGGSPLVVLYTPPNAYRLLPTSKTGVRYKADALPGMIKTIFGTQDVLANPSAIRSTLQKHGAKKTGSARLQGQPVDIYYSANFKNQGQKVKAWLRRSDSLPLRLESSSSKLNVTASWRDYRRGQALSNSLFTVPPNYKIRTQPTHR